MEESLIEEIKVLNRENDMFGTYDKAIAICNFLNLNVENFEDSIVKIMNISHEDSKKIVDFFDSIAFSNSRHIKKVLRKYISIKEYLIRKNIDLSNIYNIMSDTNFLDILFENRTYNDERVYNMINEINNII